MEIEILTTKKKITKSILDQLELVTFSNMEIFNSTNSPGYYINTSKGKIFLVESHLGWRKLIEMTSDEYYLESRRSEHLTESYLKVYNAFIRKCKNHLII